MLARGRTSGALRPLTGRGTCVGSVLRTCERLRGAGTPRDVVVAPDGRHVYMTSGVAPPRRRGGIAVLARNPRTGLLQQVAGQQGCLAYSAAGGCRRDPLMHAAGSAVLTRDGRSLLVAAGGPPSPQDPANLPGGVALLRRDPRSGSLRRPRGQRGCVIASGSFGCATSTLTNGAAALALSRDDRSLYAAVNFGTAVFALAA